MVQTFYDYSEYLSTKYAKSTKETYLINLEVYLRFLKDYKGKNDIKTIKKINKNDIYAYLSYLKDFKRNTQKIYLNSIRAFYRFLDKKLSDFLFEDMRLYGNDKKMPRILNLEQIQQILNYYSDERNSLIIFLFVNTGIRISELANIHIENIDFQSKYIDLKVKGGESRYVYLNDFLVKKIQRYVYGKKSGLLFNLKRRNIHNIVTKAMKEYGIEGSAHTLRHTYATQIYKNTHNIMMVKELLGHKSITSTQIYVHLDNNEIRNIIENSVFDGRRKNVTQM